MFYERYGIMHKMSRKIPSNKRVTNNFSSFLLLEYKICGLKFPN